MDLDALRAHYDEHGYARLRPAFPAADAADMARAVWAALAHEHGWHLDFPARGAGIGLLLKWLGYLAPVGPAGGGTVVPAGSHRLVAAFLRQAGAAEPGRSATVRDAVLGLLPQDVRRLPARGVVVSGVLVQVAELTGEPGDVVFLHPHLLHAPAANRSRAPRFMVTGGLFG
ncbi:phytanoyl-CoA dioxygenase family protein [Nonomuraea rubra]